MTDETNSEIQSNSSSEGEETINILEMTAHFKEVLEKKEEQYNDLAKRHNSLYKTMIVAYTILKLTDDFLEQIDFGNQLNAFVSLHRNIEWARSELSSKIHSYLPDEGEEEGDLVIHLQSDI